MAYMLFSFKFFILIVICPYLILCQLEELAIQWDVLQCGGLLFKGTTKCKKGLSCLRKSKWYYQCRKDCPPDWECTLNLISKETSRITSFPKTSMIPIEQETTIIDQTTQSTVIQKTDLTKIFKTKTETSKTVTDQQPTTEPSIETTIDMKDNQTTTISTSTKNETNSDYTIPNSFNITWTEFVNSVVQNNYPKPKREQYEAFVSKIKKDGGIDSKREAAMFLAQILWESGGLKHRVEIDCKETGCPGQYSSGIGAWGKSYYGRGYIQLSWDYNYKAASLSLFGDDRLLKDPDLVAKSEDLCWQTALWFWKQNVGTIKKVKKLGQFGSATNIINGGLECKGPYGDKARKRYNLYVVVLKAFNINEKPIETGCYN